MKKMPTTRSRYRVVPSNHPTLGQCWVIKEGNTVIGNPFVTKGFADKKKLQLDNEVEENFLLSTTRNQELKIEE